MVSDRSLSLEQLLLRFGGSVLQQWGDFRKSPRYPFRRLQRAGLLGGSSNPPPSNGSGTNEITGSTANTWSDYLNAGGNQGPEIGNGQTVSISCKVTGFTVSDGNTWWYQINSSPWNNNYYVSADPFYNNGATSGTLINTPFVDPNVPTCSATSGGSLPRPGAETTGSVAHTWGNYTSGGGQAGPQIASNQTVYVSCRVTGLPVLDGNSWWYQVQSSPWNDNFYVSADAFYNNGETSGTLLGTPFVDPSIPICTNNTEEPAYGTAVGSSSASTSSASSARPCRSDPVDCVSGDFWKTFTDVNVPGRGVALNLTRTYNDMNGSTQGIFGYGWTSSYDQHIIFDADANNSDGSITIVLADGSEMVAEPNGSGGFTIPQWADSTFVENANGTYTLTDHQTQLLTFEGQNSSGTGPPTGVLLSLSDLNGYVTTLSYNGAGQLSTVSDPAGRSLTFTFGTNGDVSSVTDPLGRVTTYDYDSAGDLTSTSDPLNRQWTFTYNSSHQMLTMTDPNNGTVTNVYGDSGYPGAVTSQTDAAGLTTTFSYTGDNFSSQGGSTTITDPDGNIEIERYQNGLMTQMTKGYGTSAAGTWTYNYDPNTFGVTTETDPDGNLTTHTYDSNGDQLTTTDALGNTTTYTYNNLGEVLTTETPELETTTNTYDSDGNLLSKNNPDHGVMTYGYQDGHQGDLTSVTDPDGDVTSYTYDSYGDVASDSVSPSSGVQDTAEYSYNADGEEVCQVSPNAVMQHVVCPAAGSQRAANTTTNVYDRWGARVDYQPYWRHHDQYLRRRWKPPHCCRSGRKRQLLQLRRRQ